MRDNDKLILKKVKELRRKGVFPYITISVLRPVSPSLLNRDQTGTQKTFIYGNTRRYAISAASKWAAMQDYLDMHADEFGVIQTRMMDKHIRELIAEKHPDYKDDVLEAVETGIAGIIKGEKSDKIPVRVYSKADVQELFNTTENVIKDFLTEDNKLSKSVNVVSNAITSKGKERMGETLPERPLDLEECINGTFGANGLLFKATSARSIAFGMSVTPYYDEYNDFIARDFLQDPQDQGSAHMDSVCANAAILLETMVLDLAHQVQNRMHGRDIDDPAVWDAVIEEVRTTASNLVKAFICSVPSAMQHNMLTHSAPIATVIKIGRDIPFDAASRYLNAIRSEDADSVAVARLAAYADDSAYSDNEKCYWLQNPSEDYACPDDAIIVKNLRELCAKVREDAVRS